MFMMTMMTRVLTNRGKARITNTLCTKPVKSIFAKDNLMNNLVDIHFETKELVFSVFLPS